MSLPPLFTRRQKSCRCIGSASTSRWVISDSDSDSDSDSTTSLGSEKSKFSVFSWWKRKANEKKKGIPVRKYRYCDVKEATHNFTTTIGRGNFSIVYKAKMPNGEALAVRRLPTNLRRVEKEFKAEVQLHGRLRHKNLVNLVGYCVGRGHHLLLYVYMSNGSLASHLHSEKCGVLNWNTRVNIALDVASCLEYLHHVKTPALVHRDIKSSNILLDHSMQASVTGLGLCREETLKPCSSNLLGSFGYVDPECVTTRIYTTKSDVYSFGVMLFELIAGRNPSAGLIEFVNLAVMNAEGNKGWEELADIRLGDNYDAQELNNMATLAYSCINHSARLRPSMKNIVRTLSRIKAGESFVMENGVSVSTEQHDIRISINEGAREESIKCTSSILSKSYST